MSLNRTCRNLFMLSDENVAVMRYAYISLLLVYLFTCLQGMPEFAVLKGFLFCFVVELINIGVRSLVNLVNVLLADFCWSHVSFSLYCAIKNSLMP